MQGNTLGVNGRHLNTPCIQSVYIIRNVGYHQTGACRVEYAAGTLSILQEMSHTKGSLPLRGNSSSLTYTLIKLP